jgi:hypothetical protein
MPSGPYVSDTDHYFGESKLTLLLSMLILTSSPRNAPIIFISDYKNNEHVRNLGDLCEITAPICSNDGYPAPSVPQCDRFKYNEGMRLGEATDKFGLHMLAVNWTCGIYLISAMITVPGC